MVSPSPSSPVRRRFDVCIRGAGVVGQTLALLLARERLKVALVGAPPAAGATPDVRAYALNATARSLLQSLRVWPDAITAETLPSVTAVTRMEVHGDDGGHLDFSADSQGVHALTWIVDVPALEKRLADAIGFQGSIEHVSEPVPATLTVICEGKRSRSRDELGLEFDVRPYPHKAIAARLRTERPHGGVARQWFTRGEILALLPLDGEQGNSVALVWSVPEQQSDQWQSADPQSLVQALQERCGAALGEM
ncbi:MAG: ubiquinone biosynthesis protein UbiH, partial [Hydrogenophaga sp.]|nr:ubiquinone biosynthesis protein UbiH [Hydrogenophaga sp.]